MRQLRVVGLAFTFLLGATAVGAQTPPVAAVVPRIDTLHGDVRTDNYFWLRRRENPDVIAYLQAENRYTDTVMAGTRDLQERMYQEMLGRIKQTDLSVPVRRGPYFYYSRTVEGKQYPIYARKRGSLDAPEEVYLDHNVLAEGRTYLTLGTLAISPDHRFLAYTVDTTGSERMTLMVKDLSTGEVLPDRIPDMYSSGAWAADNKTLFYTKADSAHRPDRVMRHIVGTPASSDSVIFHEPNVLFNVGVSRTKDDEYVLIGAESFTSSEYWYVPARTPLVPFRVIERRRPDIEYSVIHHKGRFLITTNDGATNFKVVTAPVSNPSAANWRDYIAHSDTVLLDGLDAFANHLVLYERSSGLRKIRIRDLRTNADHYIAFPEPVYTYSPAGNPEFDTNLLRFTYQSLITPSTVYDYDMSARALDLKKRTEVLGGYDPSLYGTERTWARAPDGKMVPVSLVYRKPFVRDGSRPMLLYSYGSYGSSTEPTFSSNNLSLVDRGVVYALAHIRGGQEMGRAWYDEGKMLNKRNTFTDFIAAAEHLVREGYSSPDKLAIRGGSAGGLLMGAVVNMRPDLFKVVIADVPFVDVINTMLDASIPLTAQEWEQWGNPSVREHYEYMRTYSPYDNVERKAYPAMLVTTGLNDPRVAFWEPAKWVAKLRAMKTDNNLLLLKTNMGAGHGGSSGRYDALREVAFRYAFILKGLGLEDVGPAK
ncbi:MAG TPA: S9 family peptidase [Gemmatimonadaceae bacterium]|nr:S9 family peptidase [Gemmatimonadaceae bacterium]